MDSKPLAKKKGQAKRPTAIIQIIEDILAVLADGKPHSIQDLSYRTRHTWGAVKRYLGLILKIQANPRIQATDLGYIMEKTEKERERVREEL
jgi:hypothetical protein